MEQMQELEKLLRVLKTNQERITAKDLKTKYRVAYEKLLEDIRQLGSEILRDQLEGLRIRDCDVDEFAPKYNQAIRDSGILQEAGRVLKNCDLEGFKEQVQRFRTIVLEIWEPYWQKIEAEGGGIGQWTTADSETTAS